MTNAFTLERVDEIAVLSFDTPDRPVNVLSKAAFFELNEFHRQILKDKSIKATVIISKKQDNFIAGADIHELANISSAPQAEKTIQDAQALFDDIARSKKPYVAAINGVCLGGGFELALACQFRMASLELTTVFGFPEVLLGLLPAAGGNQRLPRRIGLKASLPLLLTGKRIQAKLARHLGLLDAVVNSRDELLPSAIAFAKSTEGKKPAHEIKLRPWDLLVLYVAKNRVRKTSFDLYPAPAAILRGLRAGIMGGFSRGLKQDAHNFAALSQGRVAKNLMRLFFLQKERQKNPYKQVGHPVENIGIVGSGLMGSGIAYVTLLADLPVHLSDNDETALTRAQSNISQLLEKLVKKGRISENHKSRAEAKLSIGIDHAQFKRSDLVIEAIVEDLVAKQQLLKDLEPQLKPDAIFATNTSSLAIREIAAQSSMKERIVGMHYFSPVEKMPLLEVVKAKDTSTSTLFKACDVGLRQKKTIIVVKDEPGFYTTRIIAALFDEASILLLEGNRPQDLDRSMRKIGFPMGPIRVMDEVGLDVGLHVSKNLYDHFGSRLIAADLSLCEKMVEKGFLGRKRERGFYLYNTHGKQENPAWRGLVKAGQAKSPSDLQALSNRMLWRMINEAAHCLSEGVIESADDGDAGAVFGVGFPPLLGGPFKYIDTVGIRDSAKILDRLQADHGERFKKAAYFQNKKAL
ncbi:MAG TPA: 3-hydroxyacyl-CoA dehydrogenase NAD-binding domain-containing protein [Myxococcota bacterium]|nr:3-hydroxyacyl-CoA dehydrogenase NAD-binding domain-containing protein [Myxococcota bacterium]